MCVRVRVRVCVKCVLFCGSLGACIQCVCLFVCVCLCVLVHVRDRECGRVSGEADRYRSLESSFIIPVRGYLFTTSISETASVESNYRIDYRLTGRPRAMCL